MSRKAGLVVGITAAVVVVVGAVAFRTTSGSSSETLPPSAPASPQGPTQTTAPSPGLLLPNLRSLGASDLSIQTVAGQRRLRFAASLGNLGPGPLLVLPRRGSGDCPPGMLEAVQLVHADRNGNGTFERRRDAVGSRRPQGCMLDHRGHDHWHFDAMAGYSLRRAGGTESLVERPKVSFCLRDNRRVPGLPVVVRREHFGECERTGPQGISPGWVDIYPADLDGQWLRLPRAVDDEVLCLDLEADPRQLVEETDEADNATSVAIRVSGTRVRRASSRLCG
jgi:hypothetical protein